MRWLFPLLALLLAATAPPAAAQKRVALVIGNGAYRVQPALPNPRNDATAMAKMLREELGFEVLAPVINGTLRQMDEALDRFAAAAQGAEIALFFYAGHGLEIDGRNLLVPTDAVLEHERDAPRQTIPLDTILGAMQGAQTRLVLLDACRNNPIAGRMVRINPRRGASRGLAEVERADGLLISYSAAPGTTASDGNGANSPFTSALLRYLPEPGQDVGLLLRHVRQAVKQETADRQEPWVSESLTGTVVLRAAATARLEADSAAARELAALRLENERLRLQAAPVLVVPPPPPTPPPTPPPPPQGRARGFPVGIGGSFRDCRDCPEMVVIPAGSFLMGTPPTEAGRGTDEGPQRQVTLRTPLALGRTHVTVAEYRAHVEATRRPDPPSCWAYDANQRWGDLPGYNWRNPGFPQTDADPVVCLGWQDATDYAEWLRRRTGKGYRLPTEAEWEYAARAGGTSAWWWGNDPAAVCTYANAGDRTLTGAYPFLVSWLNATCTDGFLYTSPAGRFPANGFGLFDMAGNATQWVADCYRNTLEGAPADAATPVRLAECDSHTHRGGGSWHSLSTLRVGARGALAGAHRRQENGLRVARTPDE